VHNYDMVEQQVEQQEVTGGGKQEYDLHVKMPEEMRSLLKDAAQIAYKLGIIPKPDLIDLMNMCIDWGLVVLKQKWLDRMGYR